MNSDTSILQLFLQASHLVQIVMLLLLALSIFSWTVIIQRTAFLKKTKKNTENFEERFWSGIELSSLFKEAQIKKDKIQGSEKIFYAGFKEYARLHRTHNKNPEYVLEGTTRAMRISYSKEVDALENNLSFLATVGSISPYIGLFGTVWGIMHSFIALGSVKQATLSMVAPGIAEALVATAMGLFAAIPAVMFYNRLTNKVSKIEHLYETFMEEFSSILHRQSSLNTEE